MGNECGSNKQALNDVVEAEKITATIAPPVVEETPAAAPADGGDAPRRVSDKKRRRVAIAAEGTEQLANARWKSAFDALKKAETKSAEQTQRILDVLRAHTIFGQVPPHAPPGPHGV